MNPSPFNSAEQQLRERCIEMAIRTGYCDRDRVVAQAQTYFDFITGSKDAAVLAAARELAKMVTDAPRAVTP